MFYKLSFCNYKALLRHKSASKEVSVVIEYRSSLYHCFSFIIIVIGVL